MKRRAFTLIELLTVIAITALLMTIIVVPVFQSFNFTRSAQAFADAQARARLVSDRISKEIGNSVGVRSSSLLVQSILNGNITNIPQHALIVELPAKGSPSVSTPTMIEVVLPYAKLDLLKPAEGDSKNGPPYTNPVNGYIDPTLLAPKGQVVLPVGVGPTIIRYYIGLRDPFQSYNNPYDGILMQANGRPDNLYVLYRAEVQPYVYRAGTGSNGDTSVKFRPNLTYFQSDAATDSLIIDYDDPRFFLADGADPGKATRIQNWKSVSLLQSELSRYDMIQPLYPKISHLAQYDGNAPRVIPLVQFRPSHVGNDPAQGQTAVRPGEETNNAAAIGPDVFKTQFGQWSNQIVRVWPQTWDPNGAANTVNQYFVGRNDPTNGSAGAPPGFSIYYFDPSVSFADVTSGVEVFDVTTYDTVAGSGGRFPFSQALTAANNRSNWLSNNQIRNLFVPFDLNASRGKVVTSFEISEVGDPNQPVNPNNPQNLPTTMSSPLGYGPYTPTTDPNLTGNFYDAQFSTVNEKFNKVWADNPNLQPHVDRFIDLRMIPNGDGSASPLNPIQGFSKSRIVPGSEIVYGPDQMPGPNYGNTVRYVRTTHEPGPNQYQINYVDQPEPTNASGAIDYSILGLNAAQLSGFTPNNYQANNFCSAIIQPRYKKGYIKFNSDPNNPIPIGQIQVSYRFQFNGSQTGSAIFGSKSDVFAVDYDTRELMSVLVTIRNYPQTTNIPNPQTVSLKATAAVRNYLR